ncbi:FAD binding domain-containing protein [Chitinophaga japonensis]|uniref:Xanthine dehydrogenase small subunit n=1 Tax=Chitinophaga japonensis TaxID=104662 RepID=A0A562T2P7_CHIJA|nr:FAD binding domain-containing protein [Chitinophaga japonensis]TWI87909.1 xanthine dehydrogenase small subunit [Chitinophaga japonensis]
MITFILNSNTIHTDMPPGMLLLDFIRYHQHLTGTKTGCNEGDCGACTVLMGTLNNNALQYRSFTSCLTPLGNVHGRHVVTIEGINPEEGLNPIQQAMYAESATQCGFCTPGFVMSLAGFCLGHRPATAEQAIAAVDGNICRCTGYKSIERAAAKVAQLLAQRGDAAAVDFAVEQHLVPAWFAGIRERLRALQLSANGEFEPADDVQAHYVGGGTDVYVQKPEEMKLQAIRFLFDQPPLNGIAREGDRCVLGPAVTVTDLLESPLIQQYFPRFPAYARLVSSTPIRNMATIGGNFINASPIGDFTIFFLALDAMLVLSNGRSSRELPLRTLYKGYKTLDKAPEEYIAQVWFTLPGAGQQFHFEKVSKRTHLDIASVNSAISLTLDGDAIKEVRISAGGVGPVPMLLEKTAAFLQGQPLRETLVQAAIAIAQTEIAPISDARGTAEYKRLLLGQLIKAHFITLCPQLQAAAMLNHEQY